MTKPKVLITRRWPEEVEARLLSHFDVSLNTDDVPMSQNQFRDAFQGYDAIFSTVTDKIDQHAFPEDNIRVRLIGNFGVGFNNIDIETAKNRNIVVTNTPDVLTDATADLTLALLLAIARRVGDGERHLRGGDWTGWRPTHMLGREVTGKTLGIIGYGRIGQATARRAHHGFGMHIKVYSRSPIPPSILAENNAEQFDSIDELMPLSDFISLHCPATAENHHLINLNRLKLMKPESFLINAARGDLVNEEDLIKALDSGIIAGAALDVFEKEPSVTSGLMNRSDVVLLPHLGSATVETRNAMGFRVMENAISFFNGDEPPDRVV